MELLRITRQIHCKVVEQRATLIHTNTTGTEGLRTLDPLLIYTSLPPCYKILPAPLADGWQPNEDAVATQSQRLVSIVLSDTAQQRRHGAGFTK